MNAFTPPQAAEWCPDCAHERISCAHQHDRDRVPDTNESEDRGRAQA